MTAPRPAETRLIDQVIGEYQRRGYDVIVEPRIPSVPPALRSLRPDLLAVRGDDHVAVIIKTAVGGLGLRSVPDVGALHDEGWRLELVLADDPVPPTAPPDVIAARLREAEQLAASNHAVAALLLVWTAAEEVLRGLASRFAPSETGRFLSPDQAYSIGLLSESQHRLLNELERIRNQVAHAITPGPVPADIIHNAVSLLNRMSRPSYLPPQIMADRVLTESDQPGQPLEQVRRLFPDADPVDQAEAEEYIRSLQSDTSR